MRIEVKINKSLPIQLPAATFLYEKRDQVQGIPKDGLRHPFGTYNVSVNSVVSSALALVTEIDRLLQFSAQDTAREAIRSSLLIATTKQFLLAMGEHVDACEKILKCYLLPAGGNAYNKACRQFRTNLGWYERHVMAQANHIKHRHSQVRALCLYSNQIAVPGYFIESPVNDDAVGPDKLIHGGKNTAFSYNRQLRTSINGLFFISRTLTNLLQTKTSTNSKDSENDSVRSLLNKIAALPTTLFPDEYDQLYAELLEKNDHFQLSYGRGRPPRMPYNLVNFQTALGGDGVTRSFQIPYLKG